MMVLVLVREGGRPGLCCSSKYSFAVWSEGSAGELVWCSLVERQVAGGSATASYLYNSTHQSDILVWTNTNTNTTIVTTTTIIITIVMPPVRHNKLLTPLTDQELDSVTIVFHQYETGLREGTIYTKVRLGRGGG